MKKRSALRAVCGISIKLTKGEKEMECKCCSGCRCFANGECAGLSKHLESCKPCEYYPLKTSKSLEKFNETEKNERDRE